MEDEAALAEEMRRKGMMDLEMRIQEAIARRQRAVESGSYHSVENGGQDGDQGREAAGGVPEPPGLQGARPVVVTGESLTESLRNLELPKLAADATALMFGDWLTLVEPLMSDVSSSSSVWWRLTLEAATEVYQRWIQATPIERLRLRMVPDPRAARWPRTEQRAVTMLLTAIPEDIRKEVISSRRMSAGEIVLKLFTVFQPGGHQERTLLLKEISDEKGSSTSSVADLLTSLRNWRRNVMRSGEIRVQLPDPMVMVGVLTRWADQLGRLGGPQVTYRVATLRQQLALDQRPAVAQVLEFAEALQAEAEQLALMKGGGEGAPEVQRKEDTVRAAALNAGGGKENYHGGGRDAGYPKDGASKTSGDAGGRQKCRFWGTTVGCKRGEACTFSHSWEGMTKKGRCWNCSAEGHMKPECPFLSGDQKGGGSDKTKVAKTTGPKGGGKGRSLAVGGEDGGKEKALGGDPNPGVEETSGKGASGAGPKTDKRIVEDSAATTLMSEVTTLMKSLRSIKALQMKFAKTLEEGAEAGAGRTALLDGGATHALRKGTPEELRDAEAVEVELACGSTTLFRRKGSSTLLSREEVEPIIPLRLLIDQGYAITWNRSGCVICHPVDGVVKCWMRNGCPVMEREGALRLLARLEEHETKSMVDENVKSWWRRRYPDVPEKVWDFMKGQEKDWRECEGSLPWNRHQRRRIERAKGVILHLFAGEKGSFRKWKDLEETGYEVLTLDILAGGSEDLHSPRLWAYLWSLAATGVLKILFGGPPCRSVSRLRHQRPGPRPVRGRREKRFQLPNLTEREEQMVMGDTALVMKMMGLYERMVEARGERRDTAFLLEHPMDPEEYLDDVRGEDFPSIWEWEEIHQFASAYDMNFVKFDQGAMGHQRRKPTTLMSDLEELQELRGMKSETQPVEQMEKDLQKRMEQTHTWSEWAPGLVAAIKHALKNFVMGTLRMKKISIEEWRRHVAQNHVPYRRDCRICVQEMGQDAPHRRRKNGGSGEAVYIMSADIAGPFVDGWDYGRGEAAKYALIATVPVPLGIDEEELPKEPLIPLEENKGEKDLLEDPEDEIAEDADRGLAEAAGEDAEAAGEKVAEAAGEKVTEAASQEEEEKKRCQVAGEPMRTQNLTLYEPLASRQTSDLLRALDRMWAQYRAYGVPCYRFHTDRAKEFLSKQVQSWVERHGMVQTMTGGDDAASNGRIEAELCQWKRRLRLTLRASGAEPKEWPSAGRHAMEERTRAQLERLGVKSQKMIPYNTKVLVKTKKWHKRATAGMASPFLEAVLKGPCPMMSHGWVVQDDQGKVQHARTVVVTDPDSEKAQLEIEENPGMPRHRLVGKQPADPSKRLPRPRLVAGAEAEMEVGEDIPSPSSEDFEENRLVNFAEAETFEDMVQEESRARSSGSTEPHRAEPGMVHTHSERSRAEGQKKEDHSMSGSEGPGEREEGRLASLKQAGGEECGHEGGHERAQPGGGNFSAGEMRQCGDCGLLQVRSLRSCAVCGGEERPRRDWPIEGGLEGFEKDLLWRHREWRKVLKDVQDQIPEDAEEGERYGSLCAEIGRRLDGLEECLEDLRSLREERDEEKYRLMAMNAGGEEQAVLHTHTVGLGEVRRQLPDWLEALKAECDSLVHTTKAVTPIKKSSLQGRTDVEYAPGKLVATVKAPTGKKKARIVVCGNMIEASVDEQLQEVESGHKTKKKTADCYASGIDGATVRSTLRKAGERAWEVATIDVRTAFLLAPRRCEAGILVVRPPRILVEAKLVPEDVVWRVDKALYGLQSSPADWGSFRDAEMTGWKWSRGDTECCLMATKEGNLWQICGRKKGDGGPWTVEGHMVVYVDDLLITGEGPVVQSMLEKIQEKWTCSPPSWMSETPIKFCGLEISKRQNGVFVNQKSYAAELCGRYQCQRSKPIPFSPALASQMTEEADPDSPPPDPEMIRRAQTLTGELLWLSVRSRPDLAFGVGAMGRTLTRNPSLAVRIGEELVEYVNGTQTVGLLYGRLESQESYGPDGCLPFARSMKRLECYADVSFAPQGGRSVQGVVAMYGGVPVQWESSRQTCVAMSTAEAELYGYTEAMTMSESLEGVIAILEEQVVGLAEEETVEVEKVIYGDSTAAISILCTPSGPWRTRHLRLRSHALKSKLQSDDLWNIRHVPGNRLIADYLTKPIAPRAKWQDFFPVMGMIHEEEEKEEEDYEIKKEMVKVLVAGVGTLMAYGWTTTSEGEEKVRLAAMTAFGLCAVQAAQRLKEKWRRKKDGEEKVETQRRDVPRVSALRFTIGGFPGDDVRDPRYNLRVRRRNKARFFEEKWTEARVQKYLHQHSDEAEGDFWEFKENRGLLRRHHIYKRAELFGHDEWDQAWLTTTIRERRLEAMEKDYHAEGVWRSEDYCR